MTMQPPSGPTDRPGDPHGSTWGSPPHDPNVSGAPYATPGTPYGPPGSPYAAPGSPTASPSGTSLGRIVLGTFLGASLAMLVWGGIAFVITAVMAASLITTVRDEINELDSSTTGGSSIESPLSDECRAALDTLDIEDNQQACAGEDQREVLRYLNERLSDLTN